MKPVHFIASFAGHVLIIVVVALASAALRKGVPLPPDTIRISFGELPSRPGRRDKDASKTAEILPAREESAEKKEPESKPLPPKSEDEPKREAVKPEPERKTSETAQELPKPKPAEPVKPVMQDAAKELPDARPALPESDPESKGVEPGTGEDAERSAEAAPPPASGRESAAAPRGASVQARGDAGAGDTYLGLVQSKIGRRWQPSAMSTAGRPLLEAVISFRIDARGQVIDAKIFQSSGLSVFDRESLRAVLDSNPLPPPPDRFRGDGLNIQFTFTFRR